MRTRRLPIWLLITAVLWPLSVSAGIEEPADVVRRFFAAVAKGHCAEAIKLRPGFTDERCRSHPRMARVDVAPTSAVDRLRVVRLELTPGPGEPGGFRGFVTLTQSKGQWLIDDQSFRSGDDMDALMTYLETSEHRGLREQGERLRQAAPTAPQVQPSQVQPEVAGPAVQPPPPETSAQPAVQSQAEQPTPRIHPRGRQSQDLDLAPEAAAGGTPAQGEQAPAPAAAGLTEVPRTAAGPAPRPGAGSLLEACWSPVELNGRVDERKIRSGLPIDDRPPERRTSRLVLPHLGPDAARSLRSVTPRGGAKLIALTFDLCEQSNDVTGYDGGVVDTLRAHRVKATFYAGGKWMRSHPERTMQLMADPLFEIGNHAWTHGNLRVLKGSEMKDQIHWTQAQYELLRDELLARPCAAPYAAEAALIAPAPQTFRFPYGTCNGASLQAAADAGLYPVQWNIVTGDPAKGQSASQIVKTVLSGLKPGSIVVAHGNGRGWHTAEALAVLIPELRKRGYRLVTVSELIASGTPVTTEQCFELKTGDNLRYDRLFGNGTK